MRPPGLNSTLPVSARRHDLAGSVERLALRAAVQPFRALAALLAINLALAACFAGAGLVAGDEALFFRELAPGTWLSFAQLLFIAAIAAAIHRRDGARAWYQSFWGLSACVFVLFAFDEITQFTIFLSHALEDGFGLTAASGFHDLQAVLLTLGFAAAALVLLPRALVLRRHPVALCLLAAGALLGAASQSLDSFAAATRAEFVAEETLKLAAEAFLAGGFLVALRNVLARRAARPAA
jgi:hypothetical protein